MAELPIDATKKSVRAIFDYGREIASPDAMKIPAITALTAILGITCLMASPKPQVPSVQPSGVYAPGELTRPIPAINGHPDVAYQGEVLNFKAGNLLQIDIGESKSKTYDLTDKETAYAVDPEIEKGSKVDVAEGKNSAGNKVVEVKMHDKH